MTRHPDVSLLTCCDFGQNRGRFAVRELNALQKKLAEKGVVLSYTGGQADYTLPHGMPSFESQGDNGAYAAIAPNAIATVQHNGVQNPTFTGRYVGVEQSLHYNGVEYRVSENDVFLLTPACDYKVTRLNKLITDVAPTVLYPGVQGDKLNMNHIYRTGSGTQVAYDKATEKYELQCKPYVYITGGIVAIETTGAHNWIGHPGKGDDDSCSGTSWFAVKDDWLGPEKSPLPFSGHEGDSGSPVWWWSTERSRFEFVATMQGMNGSGVTYYTTAPDWTAKKLESFTKTVKLGKGQNAAITPVKLSTGKTVEDPKNKVTAQPYEGTVEVNGKEAVRFVGLKQGVTYWKDFAPMAEKENWYAYEPKDYTNPEVTIADLFLTENLRFEGNGKHSITLNEPVDMGIGYVELTGKASYELGGKGMLHCSGFMVGEGSSLKLNLPADDTLREVRKTGEGSLSLAAESDTRLNLMLGGGTTRLSHKGGYAAESVHLGNGAKLSLGSKNPVRRHVTLYNGTLELNGLAYDDTKMFSLTPLTQDAVISCGAKVSSLSLSGAVLARAGYVTDAAAGKPVGKIYPASFTDSAGSALRVVWHAESASELGDGKAILLSPARTRLLQKESALVFSGKGMRAVLTGTYTVHGDGSKDGKSAERLMRENDWHYADATAPVCIEKGAVFELWSHARLTGTVTVKDGSTFVLCAPVEAAEEYIEGGEKLEKTSGVSKYTGLNGKVVLESGARMTLKTASTEMVTDCPAVISSAADAVVTMQGQGGRVRLSAAGSSFGKLVIRGAALQDSAVTAKSVTMKVSAESAKSSSKALTVYADGMAGGSLTADTLVLELDADELQKADTLDIRLGSKSSPVMVGAVGKVQVRIVSKADGSKKTVSGKLSKSGKHTTVRVSLKKKAAAEKS